jgi:hypothetical protein
VLPHAGIRMLKIENLHAIIDGKEIFKGITHRRSAG